MKNLLLSTAALALLAGCGGEDEVKTPDAPALKEVVVRAGDAAEAPAALAAMALDQSATGALSFADSSLEGANATFTDVQITGEDALSVGTLTLEGLDMEGGVANFGKLSLKDITVEDEADVAIESLELVNPSPEFAAWIAGTLNGQEVPFPAADKLVFDSWKMGKLTGSVAEDDIDATFGIDAIEIRDMTDLKAAKAEIAGISFNGTDDQDQVIKAELGSLTLSNVNAKFVQALQEGTDEPEAMMASIMSMVAENPMETGYDAVKMSDLSFDIAGAAFAMPELSAFVERDGSGMPTKYVTEPFSMTLNADPEGGEAGAGLLQGLSILGYESLEIKGASVADYDPSSDTISMAADKNYFELVDGAKISMGGKVEGYSAYNKATANAFDFEALANGAEPDPNAMQAAFSELVIHGFEFSIADETLLDRAFNAAATSQGTDPAELKSQIGMGLAMAPMMAQGSGVDMALVSEVTGALSSFVSDGGTLTFKMAPSAPLAISDIMANPDPAAYTKDALGFTASHK